METVNIYYLMATYMGASEHSNTALQATLRNNAVKSLDQLGADGATPAVPGAMRTPARRAHCLHHMYCRASHIYISISNTTKCYMGTQLGSAMKCMRGQLGSHKQADGWSAARQALDALVEGRWLKV